MKLKYNYISYFDGYHLKKEKTNEASTLEEILPIVANKINCKTEDLKIEVEWETDIVIKLNGNLIAALFKKNAERKK